MDRSPTEVNSLCYSINGLVDGCTVVKLKLICRALGLTISGMKSELQERIWDFVAIKRSLSHDRAVTSLRACLEVARQAYNKDRTDSTQVDDFYSIMNRLTLGRSQPLAAVPRATGVARAHRNGSHVHIRGAMPHIAPNDLKRDLYFYSSIFYRLVKRVGDGFCVGRATLNADGSKTNVYSVDCSIDLCEADKAELRAKPTRRLYLLSGQMHATVDGRDQHLKFPKPVRFWYSENPKMSGRRDVPFRGIASKEGATLPIDVTEYYNPDNGNYLSIRHTDLKSDYKMYLYIAEEVPLQDMITSVAARPHLNKEDTVSCIAKIRNIERQDGMINAKDFIPLECPISKSRIRTPVRFLKDNHLGCFDLQSFIELESMGPTFICPLCLNKMHFKDLVIDDYFAEILRATSAQPAIEKIEFDNNGNWTPAKTRIEAPERPSVSVKQETSLLPDGDDVMVITLDDDGEVTEEHLLSEEATLQPGSEMETAEETAEETVQVPATLTIAQRGTVGGSVADTPVDLMTGTGHQPGFIQVRSSQVEEPVTMESLLSVRESTPSVGTTNQIAEQEDTRQSMHPLVNQNTMPLLKLQEDHDMHDATLGILARAVEGQAGNIGEGGNAKDTTKYSHSLLFQSYEYLQEFVRLQAIEADAQLRLLQGKLENPGPDIKDCVQLNEYLVNVNNVHSALEKDVRRFRNSNSSNDQARRDLRTVFARLARNLSFSTGAQLIVYQLFSLCTVKDSTLFERPDGVTDQILGTLEGTDKMIKELTWKLIGRKGVSFYTSGEVPPRKPEHWLANDMKEIIRHASLLGDNTVSALFTEVKLKELYTKAHDKRLRLEAEGMKRMQNDKAQHEQRAVEQSETSQWQSIIEQRHAREQQKDTEARATEQSEATAEAKAEAARNRAEEEQKTPRALEALQDALAKSRREQSESDAAYARTAAALYERKRHIDSKQTSLGNELVAAKVVSATLRVSSGPEETAPSKRTYPPPSMKQMPTSKRGSVPSVKRVRFTPPTQAEVIDLSDEDDD